MSCANNACRTRAAAAGRLGAPVATGSVDSGNASPTLGLAGTDGHYHFDWKVVNGRRFKSLRFEIDDPDGETTDHFKAHGFHYDDAQRAFVAPYTRKRHNFAGVVSAAKTVADLGPLSDEYVARRDKKAAAAMRKKLGRRMGAMDHLAVKTRDDDLLSSEHLADLYSRLATGLVGKPRQVILKEPTDGSSGFGTDMQGKIFAHPYPLGKEAPARENMVVTRAGMEHELGHELYTPMPVWAAVLDIARSKEPVEGLDKGRVIVPKFFNVVEDGRMEHELAAHNAGVAPGLAASCALRPRWSGPSGKDSNKAVASDVMGALLYTGLPYFEVTADERREMSPRARKIFNDLEPVVVKATQGTAEDAYHASIAIAKRFEAEGLLNVPDYGSAPPPPPKGTPKWRPAKPGEKGTKSKPRSGAGPKKCPYCGGFLTAEGKCNNSECPGPSGKPDDKKSSATPRGADKPDKPDDKGESTDEGAEDGDEGEGKSDAEEGDQDAGDGEDTDAEGDKSGGGSGGEEDEGAEDAGDDEGGEGDESGDEGAEDAGESEGGDAGEEDESGEDAEGDESGGGSGGEEDGRPAASKVGSDQDAGESEGDDAGEEDESGEDAGGDESGGGSGGEEDERPAAREYAKVGSDQDAGESEGDDAGEEDESGDDADADESGGGSGGEEDERPVAREYAKVGSDQDAGESEGGDADEEGESDEDAGGDESGGESGGEEDESGDDAGGDESSGSGGEEDESADDAEGDEDDPHHGSSSGSDASDASGDGEGARQFTEEEMDAAMQAFEREAAIVVETGIKRDNSFEALGPDLHTPLGNTSNTVTQKARDPLTGLPVNIRVERPHESDYKRRADRFKPATKPIASRLAIELDDIRSAVRVRRDRYQDEGRFDRSRLVAAYKGDVTFRYKDVREDDTSLSASLIVDLSGSMHEAVSKGNLYQAVATVSQAMTQLDMPHEIRAFGGQENDPRNFHLKAMDDPEMDDERVGLLASDTFNDDPMCDSVKLAATALMGREERNKLVLTLTDGEIVDLAETQATMAKMREKGVITFGVFYGDPNQYCWRDPSLPNIGASLDNLYGFTHGQRNWVAVSDLSEFPKKVGKRIAEIFNNLD
jgi:hypothetical protein